MGGLEAQGAEAGAIGVQRERTTRRLVAYAVALAALAAAVRLRWLHDPILGSDLPLVTLFGAVLSTCALIIGVGAAMRSAQR